MLSIIALGLAGLSAASDPRILQRSTAPASTQCFDPTTHPVNQDNYDCPSKNPNHIALNADGTCGSISPDNYCSQYCEVKLSWSYGPEISFDQTCQSGEPTCTIQQNQGVSVTNEHSFTVGFNLGNKKRDDSKVSGELSTRDDPTPTPKGPLDYITAAFNFGASWSWSNTKSSGSSTSNTKPNYALNECGYWTFVPYYVTSCGSLTYAPYIPDDEPTLTAGYPGVVEPAGHPASCDGSGTTVGNFCQSTPYLDNNGAAVGATVFVATDCDSNKPLAFCYQQKPYLDIGVSATPDMYIDYLYAHTDDEINARDTSGPATQEAVWGCFNDKWTGQFDFDPSWVQDGIGHAVKPAPPGVTPAPGV